MRAWRIYVTGTIVCIMAGIGLMWLGDKAHFLKWLSAHRTLGLDYFFYYITKLGEPPGFIAIGLILWLKSWKRMILIPVTGGIVTVVTYVLKKLFYHERPSLFLDRIGWEGPLHVLDYPMLIGHSSFPSGHAMAAWGLFTVTAALYRKNWVSVVCVLLAVVVSVSRVYLMAHFLRDVIAGAAIGFVLGCAIYFAFSKWFHELPSLTISGSNKS